MNKICKTCSFDNPQTLVKAADYLRNNTMTEIQDLPADTMENT